MASSVVRIVWLIYFGDGSGLPYKGFHNKIIKSIGKFFVKYLANYMVGRICPTLANILGVLEPTQISLAMVIIYLNKSK